MPVFVTGALWTKLNDLVQNEDSEIRKLSSWPVERTFVYVDISEFSQHPAGHQALVINSLIASVNNKSFWAGIQEQPWGDLEAQLCIGDGYIFVFRKPWIEVGFAGYLAMLLETQIGKKQIPEFHFRIGVHTGEVYRFGDYGRWNYTGTGIINGQRVVSAIGKEQDDVVFVSAET
jgi:class 3 adenylate cyclase